MSQATVLEEARKLTALVMVELRRVVRARVRSELDSRNAASARLDSLFRPGSVLGAVNVTVAPTSTDQLKYQVVAVVEIPTNLRSTRTSDGVQVAPGIVRTGYGLRVSLNGNDVVGASGDPDWPPVRTELFTAMQRSMKATGSVSNRVEVVDVDPEHSITPAAIEPEYLRSGWNRKKHYDDYDQISWVGTLLNPIDDAPYDVWIQDSLRRYRDGREEPMQDVVVTPPLEFGGVINAHGTLGEDEDVLEMGDDVFLRAHSPGRVDGHRAYTHHEALVASRSGVLLERNGSVASGYGLGIVLYCGLALAAWKRGAEGIFSPNEQRSILPGEKSRTSFASRLWDSLHRRGYAEEHAMFDLLRASRAAERSALLLPPNNLGNYLRVRDPETVDVQQLDLRLCESQPLIDYVVASLVTKRASVATLRRVEAQLPPLGRERFDDALSLFRESG